MIKEEIFDSMIHNLQKYKSFDPWVPNEKDRFRALMDVNGEIKYKNLTFKIGRTNGGGAGMGEYPATVNITIKEDFNRETNPELFL